MVSMAVPVRGNNVSIKLVPRPGSRLGGAARCVGPRLVRHCALIHGHIHRLLFDYWSSSVGGLRGDRGRTGLAVVCRLGVSAVIWLVALLWLARVGLGQSRLKALNVRLLVYLESLVTCFGQRAVSTLVSPQLRGEKCIGGVVVVAIVRRRHIGWWMVTVNWFWCRGLARWGEASPCIVGRVWINVVE